MSANDAQLNRIEAKLDKLLKAHEATALAAAMSKAVEATLAIKKAQDAAAPGAPVAPSGDALPADPGPQETRTSAETKTPGDVFYADVFVREIPADVPLEPSGVTGEDPYNADAWAFIKSRGRSGGKK